MRTNWIMLLFLGAICSTSAQQTLTEFDWQKSEQTRIPPGCSRVNIDGRTALKFANTNDAPVTVHLLKILRPGISEWAYAITGQIKYENVRGDGYLEMWNVFPPLIAGGAEGQYFSRTLGLSGEMGKIIGTSEWRMFKLPFDRTGTSNPPTRLEINLILPGKGEVYLDAVKLVEFNGRFATRGALPGAWWSEQTSGLIGGIGGTFLGCLASLLTWLAARGKSRPFVMATSTALIGFGGVLAAAGFVALTLRQPYAVWFPLLLLGALLLTILPYRFRQFQKQYEQVELRKIASFDAIH